MKNTQLLLGNNPNQKKSDQIADSKIKRPLKMFDDNGDV